VPRAPLENSSLDLTTSLQLANAGNPTIALAEETVRESLAERLQARALLLPILNAGLNVHVHRGNIETAEGIIASEDTQSLYGGFGAGVTGGGTVVVPGVHLISHLADAMYAPRIAQRQVDASSFDAIATRQQVLSEVGQAYLTLASAKARSEAYRQSLKEIDEVIRLTANFAKTGQGRDSDAQRAFAEGQLLRADLQQANEDEAVAAAELARLLDVDPSQPLLPNDDPPPLVELVDPRLTLEQLLAIALEQHPELAARSAAVAREEARLRQERVRPWLPVVSVGFSAGEFGGGSQRAEPHLGNFQPRTDFDVLAVWSLQNLTAGNHALQNRVRAQLGQALAERQLVLDRIRRDVVEALATVQSRRTEMELARKRVATAQRAFRQDLTRAQNLQGRIVEVLDSVHLLTSARQDVIRAMAEYSQAQIRLATALGNSVASLTAK
jgi:outer membrane protein TolC